MNSVGSVEQQDSLNIGRYWEIVCQRRWWLLTAFFVGWSVIVGASWFLPKKYRSETVILVEQQKVPERYVESNVAIDVQQRLQNISQQILSRSRLLQIAQAYHLYGGHAGTDSDALIERMRKDISVELLKANQNQITAFKIAYSAPSPLLAQQVSSELTALFIEDNLRNRQQLSEDTTAFLETQLQSAGADLARQEQRLSEFKSKYLGELPEQMQGNLQILAGLQSRLQGATDALNQAEQQKLYLNSLLSQYKSVQGGSAAGDSSPSLSAIQQQLAKLKNQLNDLSARYTPQHPEIARLKEQIAATEKLKANLEQDTASGKKPDLAATPADVQAMSPMMQVESQIKANQFEIANRQREIKELETETRQYEGRLNLAPVREQELAGVTRDYQQSRANYESLLAKKQQSAMATSLEKRQQGEQFHVVDPANLPLKPYFPNRFFMSLGGLGAGALLAIGIAILLEASDARIYGEADLRELTPAPVLVGIPVLSTPAEERDQFRRRWLEATAASLLLACIPVVTLLAYLKG